MDAAKKPSGANKPKRHKAADLDRKGSSGTRRDPCSIDRLCCSEADGRKTSMSISTSTSQGPLMSRSEPSKILSSRALSALGSWIPFTFSFVIATYATGCPGALVFLSRTVFRRGPRSSAGGVYQDAQRLTPSCRSARDVVGASIKVVWTRGKAMGWPALQRCH